MATDPPPDLSLEPINGPARTVAQWLTTFHLVVVALDPFAHQSAWIVRTAARILLNFQEADCRIAWLVAGKPDECRAFLGRWADEILTFSDPEGTAIKALNLEHLPAIVHLATDGSVMGAAEGWDPAEWREVTTRLARIMAWSAPKIPAGDDPGPFPGVPLVE